MKNNTLTLVIVSVVIAAIAFFGGMQYQKSKGQSFANNSVQSGQNRNGAPGRFGGRMGNGRPVVGEVVSSDSGSITVKLLDGSSKILNVSDSTTYSKTDKSSKADVKNGETIAAFGTANSDGSLTAQNIQLNPMFRLGGNK